MAEVQNKNQLTIIEGLEVFNMAIQTAEDVRQADEFAQAAIETYEEPIQTEFSDSDLLIHSLTSYILKENTSSGCLTQIRFGELLHIATCVGISYLRTQNNASRSLCLNVDAECIAFPPEEKAQYDPFIEEVKVPIESIAVIKELSK
jgi:hypothetical protein